MRLRFILLCALGGLLWPAGGAFAHIYLDAPADRGCAGEKVGPCGNTCDPARANATSFEPGATITVQWDEYINHTGHFRISFDDDGEDAFQDPTSYDDIQENPTLPVLLDGIADKASGGKYSAEVTLPDIECENCTLQLIQLMTDKPPYTIGGNDIYYRCADIALRVGAGNGDAGPTPAPDAGPGGGGDGDGGGCNVSGQSGPGAAWLLLTLGALAYVRRRRRANAAG
jgi:MYXO-CTERM domain-containing protein